MMAADNTDPTLRALNDLDALRSYSATRRKPTRAQLLASAQSWANTVEHAAQLVAQARAEYPGGVAEMKRRLSNLESAVETLRRTLREAETTAE